MVSISILILKTNVYFEKSHEGIKKYTSQRDILT